jgi:hypothetical protein
VINVQFIRKRAREWGSGGIDKRFGAALSGFAPNPDRWTTVTEGYGAAAVEQVYRDTLAGRVSLDRDHAVAGGPVRGHVGSLSHECDATIIVAPRPEISQG